MDPEERQTRELVNEMLSKVLKELVGGHDDDPPLNQQVVEMVRPHLLQNLVNRCVLGGICPAIAVKHLDFLLTPEPPDMIILTPRNLFTFMVTMEVVRDPVILALMTQHDVEDDGSWCDTFRDERATYMLSFDPEQGYDGSFLPNAPCITGTFFITPPDEEPTP